MRRLKRIGVIGQKGGTGKTPTVANIAVLAAAHGWKPVILDLDPDQASATNWGSRRGDRKPIVEVIPCLPARFKQTLAAVPDQGFDLVIVDTPGRQSIISTEAISGSDVKDPAKGCADLVIVPYRPILADTDTLPIVKRMIELGGNPPAFALITVAPPQGDRHKTAIELAQEHGFQVAPVVLFNRAAYGDGYNIGLSPTELEPKGKAAQELEELYNYIAQFLQDDNRIVTPIPKLTLV